MTETPTINGWKPPVIYDISADKYRIATQEDVDGLQSQLNVLRALYSAVRRAVEDVPTHPIRTSRNAG